MPPLASNIDHWLQRGTLWSWLLALGLSVALTTTVRLVLALFNRRFKGLVSRTQSPWDDLFLLCLKKTKTWVIFVWIAVPLFQIANPGNSDLSNALKTLFVFATLVQAGLWGLLLLHGGRARFFAKENDSSDESLSSSAALNLVYTSIQGLFVLGLILVGLSNVGVNVGALLAGLGVGGIAVALAAQNVLGDILASLSIVLDKPFVLGDYIVVGQDMGTVENIGVKTTRVRSLSGEEIIFSNRDLLENRVHNFKRMWERRVEQSFEVEFETPRTQLEQIPQWVKIFVEKHKELRFDRCHMSAYLDSGLKFEFVFFVTDSDYNLFMDRQQSILLDIFQKFEEEGIHLAKPRRVLQIEASNQLNGRQTNDVPSSFSSGFRER